MALTITVQPVAEPLTLAEVRRQCRVDLTDEDPLLSALVVAAREHVEACIGRALVTRTYQYALPATSEPFELPMPPFGALTLVESLDEDGAATTITSADYTLDTVPFVPTLEVTGLPTDAESLRVTYTAGYAAGAASSVLTITTNATAGATVTIGGVTYTWRAALTTPAVANEVKIGATAAASAANFVAAVNGAAGAGTTYSTGTVAHTLVTATQQGGANTHKVTVTALTYGTTGNSIATTSADAQCAWTGATLAGAAIPTAVLHAMLMLVEHWYRNRGATTAEAVRDTPRAVDALLSPYRVSWGF
jgi:uncharacterized phiE125 gp8 family phage protein